MKFNKSFLSAVALFGIGAGSLTSSAHAQQTAYALANGGTTLVSFSTSNPGAVTTIGSFTGANTFLDSIDFRPSTGQLYGYLSASNAFYTVDLGTGALTSAPAVTGAAANTFQLGVDFNPTIDRARIVTDSAQNLVYNPTSGATTTATSLAYALGDVNENASPSVIDNAYTNNVAGLFTTTTQYGIDYGTDSLVTIANNAGTLKTVGSLGVDADVYTGFDIFTDKNGVNSAYAILTGGTTPGLYSINLTTGSATLVGSVGGGLSQVYGLAVVPTQVPEPGVLGLAFAGLGAASSLLLRRRR